MTKNTFEETSAAFLVNKGSLRTHILRIFDILIDLDSMNTHILYNAKTRIRLAAWFTICLLNHCFAPSQAGTKTVTKHPSSTVKHPPLKISKRPSSQKAKKTKEKEQSPFIIIIPTTLAVAAICYAYSGETPTDNDTENEPELPYKETMTCDKRGVRLRKSKVPLSIPLIVYQEVRKLNIPENQCLEVKDSILREIVNDDTTDIAVIKENIKDEAFSLHASKIFLAHYMLHSYKFNITQDTYLGKVLINFEEDKYKSDDDYLFITCCVQIRKYSFHIDEAEETNFQQNELKAIEDDLIEKAKEIPLS